MFGMLQAARTEGDGVMPMSSPRQINPTAGVRIALLVVREALIVVELVASLVVVLRVVAATRSNGGAALAVVSQVAHRMVGARVLVMGTEWAQGSLAVLIQRHHGVAVVGSLLPRSVFEEGPHGDLLGVCLVTRALGLEVARGSGRPLLVGSLMMGPNGAVAEVSPLPSLRRKMHGQMKNNAGVAHLAVRH